MSFQLRKHRAFGTSQVVAREKPVYTDGVEIKLEIPLMTLLPPKLLVGGKSSQGES
jgi:hypothetical protein